MRAEAGVAAPRPAGPAAAGFLALPVLAVGPSGRYISARFPRNERLCGGAEQEGRAFMARQFVYHMQGQSKVYPGNRKILENINLSFYPDAKIGVLGVNGSGKSTLLRIMAGLATEYTGEAWVAEGARVGYLPQEPQLDATSRCARTSWRASRRRRRS